MNSSREPTGHASADGCAEQRTAVEGACAHAHAAKSAHEVAVERVRELRRDLVAAQHRLEAARRATDPALRTAEKAAARDTYRLARTTAEDEEATRAATAAYASAIDHINRTALITTRAAGRAQAAVEADEAAVVDAERAERAARLRADQADAACLDARVRLAACEEDVSVPAEDRHADVFEPHAATGGHAVAISATPVGPPLVIESMVSGDRVALELAAALIAEHTGMPRAETQLQLQELVDAVISSAAADGYLVFDTDHPFWSALTFEEARDVVAALERLGFALEPAEGWHAGRAPAPADLSMALAYAGLDARNMRRLPSAEDLLALPGSIAVDGRALLAARAPHLTIDNIVPVLGHRAEALELLWNAWGQIRPILLSDRHALGSTEG